MHYTCVMFNLCIYSAVCLNCTLNTVKEEWKTEALICQTEQNVLLSFIKRHLTSQK